MSTPETNTTDSALSQGGGSPAADEAPEPSLSNLLKRVTPMSTFRRWQILAAYRIIEFLSRRILVDSRELLAELHGDNMPDGWETEDCLDPRVHVGVTPKGVTSILIFADEVVERLIKWRHYKELKEVLNPPKVPKTRAKKGGRRE